MTARKDRIDWSQLWYPGPTRVFTPAEMARAGADAPNRTLTVMVGINAALLAFSLLQLAPQEAYIRRQQHQLAREANVYSRSTGNDPNRRVTVYGQ